MGGELRYVDPELDEAVEKLEKLGDFTTKRKASKHLGEIMNNALDEMADSIRKDLYRQVEGGAESVDEGKIGKDFGVEHDLLGL